MGGISIALSVYWSVPRWGPKLLVNFCGSWQLVAISPALMGFEDEHLH